MQLSHGKLDGTFTKLPLIPYVAVTRVHYKHLVTTGTVITGGSTGENQ